LQEKMARKRSTRVTERMDGIAAATRPNGQVIIEKHPDRARLAREPSHVAA
jgi:hypothetical protein